MVNKEMAWLVTGASTLFIVGTDVFIVSPILPSIAAEFDVSPSLAGWLVAVMAIMYACGSPLMGALFDRLQERRGLILWSGLTGLSLANLWTGSTSSFEMLLISRALAGLSLAAIAPCVYAFISDLAPVHRRAAWLSVIVSGNLTGLWAGTPLGTLLAEGWGWRSPFWLIAALSFLLAWINLVIWPKQNHSTPLPVSITPAPTTLMLRSMLVTVFWATAMYAVYTYLGTALIEDSQLTSSQLASSLIAYGLGAMLGSLNGGRMADRWGAKNVSSASLLGLVLLLGAVGLFYQYAGWLYLLLFAWAFGGYAFVPAYQSRLSVEYPHHLGLIMAWNITGMYIGMTMGAYLGGPIYQLAGFSNLAYLSAAVALVASLCSLRPAPQKKEAARAAPNHFS